MFHGEIQEIKSRILLNIKNENIFFFLIFSSQISTIHILKLIIF